MYRPSFPAAPLAVAAACLALLGGGAALAQSGGANIGKANLNPKKLPGNGGNVSVRLKIVPRRGVSINAVSAKSTRPSGGFGTVSSLSSQGGNVWTGTVRVGNNTSSKRTKVNILVDVTTSQGQILNKVVGAVQLEGSTTDPNSPPPPPDI